MVNELCALYFAGPESSCMRLTNCWTGSPEGDSTGSRLLHEEREPVYPRGGSKTQTGGWIYIHVKLSWKILSSLPDT